MSDAERGGEQGEAQPAYGEYAAPQPAYGEYAPPAPPAPQYPAYAQATPPAPPGVFTAPYAADGWGGPAATAPRPRTLGLVALLIAIAVCVLSAIASIVIGTAIGPSATNTGNGYSFSTSELTPEQVGALGGIGILMVAQIGLGTLLGILALVLGIVAAATKRGRAPGVVAIVVAVVAPILSFVVYLIGIASTLPPA